MKALWWKPGERCPVTDVTRPGNVGLDLKARCPECGKRVCVTVRGLYARHKRTGIEPQPGREDR